MPKWYDEEYAGEIKVIGFVRGNSTIHYCRNGEEIGDKQSKRYSARSILEALTDWLEITRTIY